MRVGVAVSLATAVLLCAAPARAEEPRRVLVIPLTGVVPEHPELNEAFSRAVSRVAAVGGSDVIDADASLEDAAAVVGCNPTDGNCLDVIAQSLGVEEIVFGALGPAPDGAVRVELTYHRLGNTTQRDFEIAAGDPADQARQVAREAAALLSGEEPRAPVEPAPPPAPAPAPVAAPPIIITPPPAGDTARGGVRARSWIALGAGVALSGAGAMFYVRANGRQSDIDDAPTNTPEDFRRLVELEEQADRAALTGNVLLVAGGAALVTGAILVYLDTREPSSRSPVTVGVAPSAGGATFVLSTRWP